MLLWMVAGSVLGAFLLSAITVGFHWICFRAALRDGQYAMIIGVTAPSGAILGGVTGIVMASVAAGRPGFAGPVALFGGAVMAALSVAAGWFLFSGTGRPDTRQRATATLFWFGPAILWAIILTLLPQFRR